MSHNSLSQAILTPRTGVDMVDPTSSSFAQSCLRHLRSLYTVFVFTLLACVGLSTGVAWGINIADVTQIASNLSCDLSFSAIPTHLLWNHQPEEKNENESENKKN